MFNRPPREREGVSWIWVALWLLIIYAAIPFARAMQHFVETHWGRAWFMDVAWAAVVVAAGFAVLYLYRRQRAFSLRHLWLVGVAGVYAYWTYCLRDDPEVAMHFVQYGLLGFLVFRALTHRTRDPAIYVAAILIVAIAGTTDEMIQWFTPRRVFGYDDIRLNVWAGTLVQIALALGIRPPLITRPVRASSVRRVSRLAIALLLLLGFCLSNTPPVVDWMIRRVPALSYVREKDSFMTEYGHRLTDPEIGVFYSRFTSGELRRTDAARAADAAKILDAYREPGDYAAFLKTYTPGTDPFVHEARVHMFRRDHYWSVAWKHRERDRDYRLHCTVAYRENQILEKYFGETLGHSRERLKPDEVAFLEKHLLAGEPYESPVSADVVTRFTLGQAWAAILLGVVVLAAAPRYYGRKHRDEPVLQA